MKKLLHHPVFLLAGLLLGATCASAQKLPPGVALRVVIIRHGEKPDTGNNLSCKGLNRALALPAVLRKKFPQPGHTYVPYIGTGKKKTSGDRMFQTVTPYAVQRNLYVNSIFQETDHKGLADNVRAHKGTVLIVWEHHNIPAIAQKLGVPADSAATWNGTDFDSIWLVDYRQDKHGNLKYWKFSTTQEGLKPTDVCPGQ